MGFGFPIDTWLAGPLKGWADALLEPTRLQNLPYVNASAVEQTWRTYLNGHSNSHWRLWPLLMYAQWFERWSAILTS